MIEHPEVQVFHEPFGVPHYWSNEAASAREADGERRSTSFADVAELLWRRPLAPGKAYIFSKNLSYYFAPHCLSRMSQFLCGNHTQVTHSFIIRHPAKAIASLYHKSCVDNKVTGYTHFDPAEAGFTAMAALLDHIEAQPGAPPCVIIDADDLLDDPEGIMGAYCAAVGLPFEPSMLSWQPGPVKELESPWSGWTDDVIHSSGITRRAKTSMLPQVDDLPAEVQETIAEAMPVYERMHARRLRLRPATDASQTNASQATAETIEVAVAPTAAPSLKPSPTVAAPAAAPLPHAHEAAKQRQPIGASWSLDEILFKFKTAHPATASANRPVGRENIVSLSRPIRAVLTADVLMSSCAPPVAAA